ncbi:hypothetical protein GK107_02930 [Geobacillus thermoleovorans]|nr:hypothetical protein GK107_02930 [Geobacillus thermoleovorans]
MNFDPHVHHLFFQTSFSVLNGCFLRQAEECTFAADFMEMTLARPTRLKKPDIRSGLIFMIFVKTASASCPLTVRSPFKLLTVSF